MANPLVGHIVVFLDGARQKSESAVTIHDRVGQPCRVTVEEILLSTGPEYDGRKKLGQPVLVDLFLKAFGDLTAEPFMRMQGKVVEAVTAGLVDTGVCTHTFTIEHDPPSSSDEAVAEVSAP